MAVSLPMTGRNPTGEPGPAPAILQVLPALNVGGVERGTVEIAQAIVEAGWRAVVASSGGPLVAEIERAGGEHVALPLDSKNPLTMWRNVGRLHGLIRERDIAIVHARSRAPAWSALYAARRGGARFLTTFHGFYSARTGLKRRYNAVMARGERVIAVSRFVAEHAAEVYGVPHSSLRTVPRGIDPELFDPARVSEGRVARLREAWLAGGGGPVVMLPGRLSRWKGHATAVEAMARLSRADVRCLFVGAEAGSGGYGAVVRKAIDDAGLAGRVRFAGVCDDMPAAYLLADVVLVASTEPESFGRVAVEAQAMGRPLVAAEHGSTRETVIDGETGRLVPPGDVGALARAISEALDLPPDRRAQRAEAAMRHVRTRFTLEAMRRGTLAVYRELLDKTPR